MEKYSDDEKRRWREMSEKQKEQMQGMIKNLTDTWQENPETIAEMLEFGSRIYRYSMRNNMLIYSQNPYATYVQSFDAWKKMGASIKKGEKGCKVYVPVNATVLKIEGHLVPLEQATKEQQIQYKAGEIESITRQHFRIGTVFDISQTTYPKENYPKLFHMGYQSVLHAAVTAGLVEYARTELHCPVEVRDLTSISLRENYDPQNNRIRLNEMLEDTEKLSTMSHELGRALLHQDLPAGKTAAQVELEADALGIMLESHFGIPLEESRKRHLAKQYHAYHKAYEKAPEGQKPDSFGQVINQVFATFKKEISVINEYVDKHLKKEEQVLAKKGMRIEEQYKKYPQSAVQELGKDEIYDRIKREVNILDYAGMHGIELQRVGRYYTLKGHDSVRIDPDKNCFWRNSGIGQTTTGSVIDFANAFVHNEDLHESLKELTGLVSGIYEVTNTVPSVHQKTQQTRKSLEENLPERAKNMHRAYAYLTQTRFIEPDVVQDFVNRKMLYQDVKGNCVFVAYDETQKPVFASFRGTLSERKFLGDVSGSDYRKGFYIDNKSDKLIVTESVIDAMSVMSILYGQGVDYKQYDYLPLNSADKHATLLAHLADSPKEEVFLAFDHDLTGVKNMQLLKEEILDERSGFDMKSEQITFHVPEKKDWNEELVDKMKHLQSVKEIDFLSAAELPKIHYCAVQSTQHMEERGFHKREGQDQYRLVELDEQGNIMPMDIKRNVIFKQPDELKKYVPEMYEKIPYNSLQQMQETQHQMQKDIVTENDQIQKVSLPENEQGLEKRLSFQKEHGITVHGFEAKDKMLIAKISQNGIESEEAVMRQGERFYASVGYVFDNSYVEFDLTEEQQDELEAYITGHGLKLNEESLMLMVEETAGELEGDAPEAEPKGTDFLNALQHQEFQTEEIVPEQEMVIGIGG